MTEKSVAPGRSGKRYRQYLNMAALNWVLPMPHSLKNAVELKAPNIVFMKGVPYPEPVLPEGLDLTPVDFKPGNTLKLFHCSNLDWNYSDFRPERNSTKGNHKFLYAFVRALQEGLNLHLTILDRGPDKEIAKEIIARAGIENAVTWKDGLNRDELYQEILGSHIVVNMFHHGGTGGISYETLKLGRPLMQYANPVYFDLMYGGSVPPFINARTEEDILDQLRWAISTRDLNEIALDGKKWAEENIYSDSALHPFLFYYSLLTGDKKMEYGPFIEEMESHIKEIEAGTYDPYAGISSYKNRKRAS